MEGAKNSAHGTQLSSGTQQIFSGIGKYLRAVKKFLGNAKKSEGTLKCLPGEQNNLWVNIKIFCDGAYTFGARLKYSRSIHNIRGARMYNSGQMKMFARRKIYF
jgi:hypothetical protein